MCDFEDVGIVIKLERMKWFMGWKPYIVIMVGNFESA